MRVDGNISDLFFNTEHHVSHDQKGQFADHDELETEAKYFLDCLDRLGVPTPTVDELIADFRERL